MFRFFKVAAFCGLPALAQLPTCTALVWNACDLKFSSEVRAEFRSPRARTLALNSFREADGQWVIRFAPTEPGSWEYKLGDGQQGRIIAMESDAPGFVRVANVHHFATENNKQHLWIGTELANFAKIPRSEFTASVEQRAKDFTHLRVAIEPDTDLREAADRVREINSRGLVADLTLAAIPADRDARTKYLSDLVPRFAALNITWMGSPAFENQPREVIDSVGTLIARLDPYQHPRTSMAETTSAPLTARAQPWMNIISYGTASADVGAPEHQFYQLPAINTGIKSVRDLWNATMNGQYPDSGEGPYMRAWRQFMGGNRYWELEPYFDVDGGRAVALEGVEYIVYVEKPGPVEVTVESHSYDVAWINPLTGERIKAKDYKGQHFTGEPPDRSHEWILHISREGTKEGMLRSYKFESRRVPVQEIESAAEKVPFDVSAPPEGELSISKGVPYELKIRRESRATRSLLVEWTLEVPTDGEGYRVVGTGTRGTLKIPASIAHKLPAVASMRVQILNANGKAYELDRSYKLVQ